MNYLELKHHLAKMKRKQLIRIAKQEGKITDLEAKNLYLNFCERVLANVELKQGTSVE